MRTGTSVRLGKLCACLNCGEMMDGATAVGEEGRVMPSPGDVTVCLYCGHLMMFDDQLAFRNPSDAEIIELAGDERVVTIGKARTAIQN